MGRHHKSVVQAGGFSEGMNAAELKAKFPNASASFIQANTDGVCASQPERPQGRALDSDVSRKEKSGPRVEIGIVVFSRRPCDWDNYFTKPLQDLLVTAGLLHADGWRHLGGRVSSRKVSTQGEERTEITITPFQGAAK